MIQIKQRHLGGANYTFLTETTKLLSYITFYVLHEIKMSINKFLFHFQQLRTLQKFNPPYHLNRSSHCFFATIFLLHLLNRFWIRASTRRLNRKVRLRYRTRASELEESRVRFWRRWLWRKRERRCQKRKTSEK